MLPGAPRQDIKVEGDAGYALLKMGVYMALKAGTSRSTIRVVGEKLAYVLSGGRLTGEQTGFGAVSAGPGAGSVPEPVRTGEDAGAHAAHAEDREAAAELNQEGDMREAVIVDCLRTAVGKAPQGRCATTRPDDLGAIVIRALLESYPAGEGCGGGRHPGMRHAGGRVGQQYGAAIARCAPGCRTRFRQ